MDTILTLVEKTALLKNTEVFASVPTEALADLAARSRELHFEAGEEVVREGQPNQGSFLVVEGKLEVRAGGIFLRVVEAGTGFAQLELGENEPHTLAISALEHTHALNLTPEDVTDAIMDFPEVGLSLVRMLAGRLRELVDLRLHLEARIAELSQDLLRQEAGAPSS
jgi:CRP-like cAMP-binding protein